MRPTSLNHHLLEPLIQGEVGPSFHVVYAKLWPCYLNKCRLLKPGKRGNLSLELAVGKTIGFEPQTAEEVLIPNVVWKVFSRLHSPTISLWVSFSTTATFHLLFTTVSSLLFPGLPLPVPFCSSFGFSSQTNSSLRLARSMVVIGRACESQEGGELHGCIHSQHVSYFSRPLRFPELSSTSADIEGETGWK